MAFRTKKNYVVEYFWSREPGNFVAKDTGKSIKEILEKYNIQGPSFPRDQKEWNETLIEVTLDVSNEIKSKFDFPATHVRCHPDVIELYTSTVLFRSSVSSDESVVGSLLGGKFEVISDGGFDRDLIEVYAFERDGSKVAASIKVLDLPEESSTT